MNTRQKAQHGGAREGSGRKPVTLSRIQVKQMLEKAQEWAEKTGKEVDDILLATIHSDYEYLGLPEPINLKDRLAAVKLFKDKTMAVIHEGGDADRNLGPQTYLPEERPDNVVPLKAENE